MKIAILVHNTIVGDARVRKEARSLSDVGYEVDLIGYGDLTNAPDKLENCNLILVKKSPLISWYRSAKEFVGKTDEVIEKLKVFGKELIASQDNGKPASYRYFVIYFSLFALALAHLPQSFVDAQHTLLLCLATIIASVLAFRSGWIRKREFYLIGFFVQASVWTLMPSANYLLGIILIVLCIYLSINALNIIKNRLKILNRLQRRYIIPRRYNHIASQIIRSVDVKKYDVIHAHDIIGLIAAVELKKKQPQIKIVWDAHELYPELKSISSVSSEFMRRVITRSSVHIDYFITINQSFIDYYREKFPRMPSGTILMNAARKEGSSIQKNNFLRSAAGISEDQFVLLFQGGLSADRGVEILLDAAEKIPECWSVIFMGDGLLGEGVKKKIDEFRGLRPPGREAIALIPAAPYHDLASWTSGADLGVIPYENVGLNHLYCTPNKLWEYPNAGIPILATNMIEMAKMIEEYQTGILLPTKFNSGDVVSALEAIDRPQLNKLTKNCRKFTAVENWEKYEKRLIVLYKEIENSKISL